MPLSNQQIQAIKSLEGHVIPNDICEGPDGAVGHYIETELIKRGIPIDRTGIVDVPFTGDEVKTRNMASNANHTVGTSTIDEIKNKSYKQSNFKKKLTSQIRIEWSNKFNEVAHADIRDLSSSEVQNYFEELYETSKKELMDTLSDDPDRQFGKHESFGNFEHKGSNSFAFRITSAQMKKALTMARSSTARNNIFSFS